MTITTKGYPELKRNLEALRARMTGDIARQAVRAGAKVIAGAMKEAAPVLDNKTANSTALDPGALQADIKARVSAKNGVITGISGPTKKTAYVARWVEYGHRMVTGGQSKVLANGKTRGAGKVSDVDVPAHPFLRPAFEASVQEAEDARDAVLRRGMQGEVS